MKAEAFNQSNFLSEYKTYNYRQYTAAENGKAAMEARDLAKAEEAVKAQGLLSLTLSEKIAELGVGKRVIQQLGDTAINAVGEIISPVTEWLEKYENIFDERVYNAEMQVMGKQMFFAQQALSNEAASGKVGQNFVLDM